MYIQLSRNQFETKRSPFQHITQIARSLNQSTDAKLFLQLASKYSYDLSYLDEIAYLQSELKDYQGSIETLTKCLDSPNLNQRQIYSIRSNLAKVYNHLNDPVSSLAQSTKNLEQEPSLFPYQPNYDTRMEIAFSHYLLGDYQTSESMMRELLTHKNLPEQVKGRVLYNLGSYDLSQGKFQDGLKGFVGVGHKIKIWLDQKIPGIPFWDYEKPWSKPNPGSTILIHGEGGIGDEIINVRFMKNLKDLGYRPIWKTNNKYLKDVFNRNGFETILESEVDEIKDSIDCQCLAMFLPILLELNEEDLWTGPYLTPSEEYIEKWKDILPRDQKLLAVKWQGSPFYDQDLHRSLPLQSIKDLPWDGIKVNLQLETEVDEFFNAGSMIESIEDTLAILWLCDSMVSSCTSVVHMNAAMGKNGIVCPPIAKYYVWLTGDDDWTWWYDKSLKVLSQKNHKDWSHLMNICEFI